MSLFSPDFIQGSNEANEQFENIFNYIHAHIATSFVESDIITDKQILKVSIASDSATFIIYQTSVLEGNLYLNIQAQYRYSDDDKYHEKAPRIIFAVKDVKVPENLRGNKVGTNLILAYEEALKNLGYTSEFMAFDVGLNDDRAISFWRSLGYDFVNIKAGSLNHMYKINF